MEESQGPAPSGANSDSIILEEEIDPNYVPSEAEVIEYAKWLGMDLDKDQDLFWIAREGLMAPLPKHWKPCKTKDTEDIYYFNFQTGESTWDHPCDGYYKRLYDEEKKKREISLKASGDENRTKAKQDVEQLLGKSEKKKKKSSKNVELNSVASPGKSGNPLGALTLEKKPLPGIRALSTSSMDPLSSRHSRDSQEGSDSDQSQAKGLSRSRDKSRERDRDRDIPPRDKDRERDRDREDHNEIGDDRRSSKSRLGNRGRDDSDDDSSSMPKKEREREREKEREREREKEREREREKEREREREKERERERLKERERERLKERDRGSDRDVEGRGDVSSQRQRNAEEIERMQEDHEDELRRLKAKFKAEIEDAQEDHDREMKSRRKEWEEDLLEMKEKLKTQRKQMQTEYDDLDTELAKKQRSHKDKCFELDKQKQSLEDEVEQLEQKLNKVKKSSEDAETRAGPVSGRVDDGEYKREIADLKSKLRDAQDSADTFRRRCEKLESKLADVEADGASREKVFEQRMKQMREDHEEELDALKKQLRDARDATSDRASLGQESTRWEQERQQLQSRIRDQEEELQKWKQRAADKDLELSRERELRRKEVSLSREAEDATHTQTSQIQSIRNEYEELVRDLKDRLAKVEADESSSQRKATQATRERDDLKASLTGTENKYQSLLRDLEKSQEQERSTASKIREMERKIEENMDEIHRLGREVDVKTRQLSDATEEVERHKGKISGLLSAKAGDSSPSEDSREIERLQKQVKAVEQRAEEEQSRLDEQLRALRAKNSETVSELTATKDKMEELAIRSRRSEQLLADKDQEILDADRKLQVSKAREAELQEEVDKYGKEIHRLRNQLNEEADQVFSLGKKLKEKDIEIDTLQGSLSRASASDSTVAITAELEKVTKSLREAKAAAEDAQYTITQRETEIARLKGDLSSSSETVQALRSELLSYEEEKVKLGRAQIQIQQLQSDLEATRASLEQKDTDHKRQREEWSRQSSSDDKLRLLMDETEQLKSEVQSKNRLLASKESEISDLSFQLTQKDQELKRVREEVSRLTANDDKNRSVALEKSQLEADMAHLKQVLAKSQTESEDLRRQLQERDIESIRMKEEVTRLQVWEERCKTAITERESAQLDLKNKSIATLALESAVAETQRKFELKEKEISNLKEEISALSSAKEKSRAEVEKLREAMRKSEESRQDTARSELQQATGTVRELEQKLSVERAATSAKDRQIKELHEEVGRLKQSLVAAEQERDQKQQILDSRGSDREKESPLVASLKLDLSNATKRLAELESRSKVLQARIHELESKESDLNEILDESRSASQKLRLSSEADARALEDLKQRVQQSVEEISGLRKDKEKFQDLYRTTEVEKEKLLGKLQGIEHANGTYQQRESQLIQERDRERELSKSLEAANRELELKLARCQSELEQAKIQLTQLRSQESNYTANRAEESEALAAARRSELVLQAEVDSLRREMAASKKGYEDRIANLQQQLKSIPPAIGPGAGAAFRPSSGSYAPQQQQLPSRTEVWLEEDMPNLDMSPNKFGDHEYRGSSAPNGKSDSSVLLEVLQRFLELHTQQKKTSSKDKDRGKYNGSTPKRTSRKPASSYWVKKLADENKFLKDSQLALREEKDAIKKRQARLAQKRQAWKEEKSSLEGGRTARGRTLTEAKALLKKSAQELNRQATELNERIAAMRMSSDWLERREKKVSRLASIVDEKLHRRSSEEFDTMQSELMSERSLASPLGGGSSSGSVDSPVNSLLEDVELELDSDIEMFGQESLTMGFGSSPDDLPPTGGRYRSRKKSSTPTRSSSAARGSREDFAKKTQLHYQTAMDHPGNEAASQLPYGVPYYTVPVQSMPLPGNGGGWMYPPPMPMPLQNAPVMSSWSVGNHNGFYPSRQVPSSQASAWSTVGVSSASDIRRELHQLAGERGQTKDVYDQHASWLDGLRKEIGKFNHGTASSLIIKTEDSIPPDRPSSRVDIYEV